MMDRSVTDPPQREGNVRDGDPLNLKGSYDAPAFLRLGRKLGSDVPFSPPGAMMNEGMTERYS